VASTSPACSFQLFLPRRKSETDYSALDTVPDSHSCDSRDEAGCHHILQLACPKDRPSLTSIVDIVAYALPFGPLGRLFSDRQTAVKHDVRARKLGLPIVILAASAQIKSVMPRTANTGKRGRTSKLNGLYEPGSTHGSAACK
jgi:hypothetical protein